MLARFSYRLMNLLGLNATSDFRQWPFRATTYLRSECCECEIRCSYHYEGGVRDSGNVNLSVCEVESINLRVVGTRATLRPMTPHMFSQASWGGTASRRRVVACSTPTQG